MMVIVINAQEVLPTSWSKPVASVCMTHGSHPAHAMSCADYLAHTQGFESVKKELFGRLHDIARAQIFPAQPPRVQPPPGPMSHNLLAAHSNGDGQPHPQHKLAPGLSTVEDAVDTQTLSSNQRQ